MSFINGITQPKDVLLKLVREGNRINFEGNQIDLADHFFNFSVTAHSLRDWCIKYTSQEKYKKQLHEKWNQEQCLLIARDIANSVKHFTIDRYTPDLSGSLVSSTQGIAFYSRENILEKMEAVQQSTEYRDSQTETSPSFIITFTNGDTENLTDYAFNTIKYWEKYFDDNHIPRYPIDCSFIFLNRACWQAWQAMQFKNQPD